MGVECESTHIFDKKDCLTKMAINVCRKARPSGFPTRIHGFAEPTATKESITSMNFTRSQEHSPAVVHSTTERSELEHLFDFELQATPGRQPYTSTQDREGTFVINSIGTLTGKIRGKIRMSFFALDCAYLLVQAGVDPGPGQHLCKENDGGVIETGQWLCSSQQPTSATSGSTQHSVSGKANSTRRKARQDTKATYEDMIRNTNPPLYCS